MDDSTFTVHGSLHYRPTGDELINGCVRGNTALTDWIYSLWLLFGCSLLSSRCVLMQMFRFSCVFSQSLLPVCFMSHCKVFHLLNFLDAVYDFHHSKHREEPICFVFHTESNGACQNVCCEETNYVIRTKCLL